MKNGEVITKVFDNELVVEGGRVGRFNLTSTYTHQDEDFSRVNYYTPENERQNGELTFEYKGYEFKAVDWQVNKLGKGTAKEIKSGLEKVGLKHYIIAKAKINGKIQSGTVMITENEYNAIKKWFESVKMTQQKAEKEVKKADYSEKIAEAKENGKLVIINRYAVSVDSEESDTAIVTVYIDENGVITKSTDLMD